MSARHRFLEVDMLDGLLVLASQPAPRYLVGPSNRDSPEEVRKLLKEEAWNFHSVEAKVAGRRQQALADAAKAYEDQPGQASLSDAAAAAARDANAHRRELDQIDNLIRRALGAFEIRAHAEIETLKAGKSGLVVELYQDGWALAADLEAQLAARREHLGLPEGRDWLPREGV
jgi:hypothetical protein